MRTKEKIEWKVEVDSDTNNKGTSDNLHKNRNPRNKSKVQSTPLQQRLPPITFTDRDFKGINPMNQDDPMVISIIIASFMVFKVLINQGNSTNMLYWKTFHRFKVSRDTVHPHAGPLLGFICKRVETRGYIDLTTTFGQGQLSKSFTIWYLLVDAYTSYFSLIGRKTLNELGAIVSTVHPKMKFPTLRGRLWLSR